MNTQSDNATIPQSSSDGGVKAWQQGAEYTPETIVVNPEVQSQMTPDIALNSAGGTFKPNRSSGSFGKIFGMLFFVMLLGIGGWYAYQKLFLKTGGKSSSQVTIQYWGLWEQDANLRAVLASFEEKFPNIHVQYTMQSPKQYRERLQSAIARGEGPDAFRFHNTWVPMIARDLAPVPESIMTSTDFANTFYQVASSDLVAGATIYGIPMMIDGLGLYINEDLFIKASVAPPVTWTDVINIVPALTVKNGTTIITSAIALGTANNVEHFSDILSIMFMQNGAKLSTMSGVEAEETLIFYRKFADPADPLFTWNDTMDNSVSAFATGRVAMILAPSWRAHEIKQLNPSLRFHISPIPQLPGNAINWASYWVEGVSAQSKYPQETWEFIRYMTSVEATTMLYTDTAKTRLFGEPYARVEQGNSLTNDPYVGAYIVQASTAHSFPLASRTFDNGLNDKLIKYLEDAVNSLVLGNAPTKALETVSAGFRQVLSTYGLITNPPASQ